MHRKSHTGCVHSPTGSVYAQEVYTHRKHVHTRSVHTWGVHSLAGSVCTQEVGRRGARSHRLPEEERQRAVHTPLGSAHHDRRKSSAWRRQDVTCGRRESGHEEGASRDQAVWDLGVSPASPAIPQDPRPQAGALHHAASVQVRAADLVTALGRARGEHGPSAWASTRRGWPRPPGGRGASDTHGRRSLPVLLHPRSLPG